MGDASDKVTDGEWRQHLRPYGKRDFWKQERKAQQQDIKDRLLDTLDDVQSVMPDQYVTAEAGDES